MVVHVVRWLIVVARTCKVDFFISEWMKANIRSVPSCFPISRDSSGVVELAGG